MTVTAELRLRTGYLGLKEVAAKLGCHPQTLYKRLRKDPTAIPHLIDGTRFKFDRHQLADWIEARQLG